MNCFVTCCLLPWKDHGEDKACVVHGMIAPVIVESRDQEEAAWIGVDEPSLEAKDEDQFEVQMPGFNLRRLILARDPLAAALAFSVQVRCILATLFGIRMCPDCPHCAESDSPCQDAFGSSAEAMGGIAGRSCFPDV